MPWHRGGLNQLEREAAVSFQYAGRGISYPRRPRDLPSRLGRDPIGRHAGCHHLYTFKSSKLEERGACSASIPAMSGQASTTSRSPSCGKTGGGAISKNRSASTVNKGVGPGSWRCLWPPKALPYRKGRA